MENKRAANEERFWNFGECWNFLNKRARVYFYNLKDYAKALTDVNRCIKISPQNYESYILKGKILLWQHKLWEAADCLSDIEKLCYDEEAIADFKKRASGFFLSEGYKTYKQDPVKAIQLYNEAAELYPLNAEIYYWRGVAYMQVGDDENATHNIELAIFFDEGYFDAYRYIDWLFARHGRWDEIIYYWNKYISVKPNDAAAYAERSGTYYHKGGYTASYLDAKKACGLGNKETCQWAERVKIMSNH